MKHLKEIKDWKESFNAVLCGDSLELMKMIPDNAIDLCLTDPPYGIGMDNQKIRTKPNRPNTRGRGGELQYEIAEWDKMAVHKKYFDEIFRISKKQIVWGANYYSSYFPNGFGWLYWDKQMGENNFSSGEFAFQSIFIKSSSFSYPSMRVKNTRSHPTQKPLELMRWCLENYAKDCKTVIDPFAGSFTTARACKDMGYDFIAIDQEEKYCSIGERRLRQQNLF